MTQFSESFLLLQQEGYLIQSVLCSGLTDLRNSHVHNKGGFYSASFNLSIGLERLMKALHIMDFMLQNHGQTPSRSKLKGFGHDLLDLYESSVATSQRYSVQLSPLNELSTTKVAMLTLLSSFAKIARYHNLDSLASGVAKQDPLSDWSRIFDQILQFEVKPSQIERIVRPAEGVADALSDVTTVIMHDLNRQPMNHFGALALPALQQLASRYAVLHMIQFLVPFRNLLSDVSRHAYGFGGGLPLIPQMQEFMEWAWDDRATVMRKKRWP